MHQCAACSCDLPEERRVEAWWKKIGERASFCLVCFGEIFFNILPKLTAGGITTRHAAHNINLRMRFIGKDSHSANQPDERLKYIKLAHGLHKKSRKK